MLVMYSCVLWGAVFTLNKLRITMEFVVVKAR
jgi:hypothetical protein